MVVLLDDHLVGRRGEQLAERPGLGREPRPRALLHDAPGLEHGDLLFFYTDGLVEAENDEGDMFGAERLQQLLAEAQSRDIDALLRHVEENVRAFRGSVEPLDDATMMALRVI